MNIDSGGYSPTKWTYAPLRIDREPSPRGKTLELNDLGDVTKVTQSPDGKLTKGFAEFLQEVTSSEQVAQASVTNYANGKNQSLHETMITLEKADIRFSLLLNIRNKLLDAYREVMRMG